MLTYKKVRLCEYEADLMRLYAECFDETKKGIELTFENYLRFAEVYAAFEDKLCAALYLLPASVVADKNGGALPAEYLFAAGTLRDYRSKGIMGGLVRFALESGKKADLNCLLPANEGLYGFYERLGYKTSFCKRALILSKDDIKGSAAELVVPEPDKLNGIRNGFLKSRIGSVIFPDEYMSFAIKYYSEFGGVIASKTGYMLYYRGVDEVYIAETMCRQEEFTLLAAALAAAEPAARYRFNLPLWFENIGERQKNGMAFFFNKSVDLNFSQAYLGLTFD